MQPGAIARVNVASIVISPAAAFAVVVQVAARSRLTNTVLSELAAIVSPVIHTL